MPKTVGSAGQLKWTSAVAESTPLPITPRELVIFTAHVGVGRSAMAPASEGWDSMDEKLDFIRDR